MTLPNLHLIFLFSFLQYFAIAKSEADGSVYLVNKDPVYINHICSTTKNFTLNSPYHINLNTLLSSLSSHATGAVDFFNTTVIGGGCGINASEAIHGLFLCRGDVTRQMCKNCVKLAIQKIASRCFYSKGAIIWYHECSVRYSDRSIFSALEESRRIKIGNFSTIPDSSNQGEIGWLLANTLNEAITVASTFSPLNFFGKIT